MPSYSAITNATSQAANTNAKVSPLTGRQIWEEYRRDPDRHPNIPNCSYAGYHAGEKPLPEPPVKANVCDFGAKPNSEDDATAAFNAAITAAAKAGGGAVFAPAGKYVLSGIIRLSQDGVVLRGAGPGKTILDFRRSLVDILGKKAMAFTGWSGGLVWLGPGDNFSENWQTGPVLARLTAEAARGDRTVVVDDAARLKSGALVLMEWEPDSSDHFSLQRHIYGHSPTAARIPGKEVGDCGYMKQAPFTWPVEIASIAGTNKVALIQPLRLDARSGWKTRFCEIGPVVREAGVERLTINLHVPLTYMHCKGGGWNGVYFDRAYDCWVRDVEVNDAENGIGLASAKRVSVTGVRIGGSHPLHHGLACRAHSFDNLFADFRIDGPSWVMHGANVEFSGGNVWSRGFLRLGTFDSHRGLPFDNIYTDITVANDARSWCGGSYSAGPRTGCRTARWNVRIGVEGQKDARGIVVNQLKLLPMGALVGVQGAPLCRDEANNMPPGDKGCLVADPGMVPDPPNLYEAQLKLRLEQK